MHPNKAFEEKSGKPIKESELDNVLCLSVSEKVAPQVVEVSMQDVNKINCVVYDCELEPFEFSNQNNSDSDCSESEPEFHPEINTKRRFSLTHVFEDQDLADEIMCSLEVDQLFQQAQQLNLSPIRAPLLPNVLPSIRKPGTFLNKDGRWIKGKPCRMDNCDKRAQSNGLCKGHGGGARCNFHGCTKSSQGGGFCRAHGGGKRCMHEGCEKGTQRNGYCYLHGGVRSCNVEGCDKKDRGNGKCFSHGVGRKCGTTYCDNMTRRGMFCDKHTIGGDDANSF
jgi:hypothetical protein